MGKGALTLRPKPNYAAIVAPQRRYVHIDSYWLRARQHRALVKLPGNPTSRTSIAPKGAHQRRPIVKLVIRRRDV